MVQQHSVFERQGDELHCVLTLPMTSAALGTTVKIDTLDGEQEIDVRPGTQPGAVVTLRGLGASRLRGGGRGDLYVHIDVAIPTKLDDAQAMLLKQLADLRSEDVARVGDGAGDAGGGLFTRLKDAFSPK
jgi:molecular chaperone DnaJ